MDVAEWLAEKPDCNECKEFKRQIGKVPPCDTCQPEIMIENDDVLKIYNVVSGQVIVAGMDGTIVDLDQNALFKVMELYEIENRQDTFERVNWLFHEVLKIQRENNPQSARGA